MRGSRGKFLRSNFREVTRSQIDAIRRKAIDGSDSLADRLQFEADEWESLGLENGYFETRTHSSSADPQLQSTSAAAFSEAIVRAWADLDDRDAAFLALVHFASDNGWSQYVRGTSEAMQSVIAGEVTDEDVHSLAWLFASNESDEDGPAYWRTRWDSEELRERVGTWLKLRDELLEVARKSVNEAQSRYFDRAFQSISHHERSSQLPSARTERAISDATGVVRSFDDHRVAFQTAGSVQITGGKPLRGSLHVGGGKNFVTKAMVASLLGEGDSVLRNVPKLGDVQVVRSLLEVHGVAIKDEGEGVLRLDPSGIESAHMEEIDAHAGASRVPILFCGPLLHRLGQAFIPDLGGCRIGDRPIDFHLDALRAFGATVDKLPSGIRLSAPPEGLRGADIVLPYPSVGATEQVLLTAVRAKGTTELRNAAIEPEIFDLIAVLQKMGSIISYEPNRVIIIEGVDTLQGYDHWSIFDRNETAAWACAALATDGEIFVEGARQLEMLAFLDAFRRVGGDFRVQREGISFKRAPERDRPSVQIETDVHPGFMTDWQQPLVVALTQVTGRSVVHETVYENRFGFTEALIQMGADIVVHPEGIPSDTRRVPRRSIEQAAVVTGPTPLHASNVRVEDLRGGWSLVLAALIAEGESRVDNVGMLARAYEDLFAKLISVGATVEILEPWSSAMERQHVDA